MEPIGGDLARHDHEFDEVRWIPFDHAPTMLTFETERALVARAAQLIARPGRRTGRGPDRGRLVTDALETPIHLTPLTDAHRDLGARLIEFGGWLMPVQYGSIIDEHRTVRERVGLFDLSHMGELYVDGPEAGLALASALISDPPALAIGRAQYSMICAADGGIIDDLIVYRLGEESFLVVANAGNAAIVSDALAARLEGFKAVLDDRSLATGLLAVQGPLAAEVLGPLTDVDLTALRYYAAAEGTVAGIPALVARTGYTGEDGFEVFVETAATARLWDALLEAVRAAGGGPVGLGRPRHPPAGGRDAALRQRAGPRDEPLRSRARPRRQARQAGRLRRSRGAREGRRGWTCPASRRPDRGGPRDRPPWLSGLVGRRGGPGS